MTQSLIWHDASGYHRMGPGERLGRGHPDRPSQRRQLGCEPESSWLPAARVIGETGRGLRSGQQRAGLQLAIDPTQPTIAQYHVDCRHGRRHRRRHAGQPRKISQRVGHALESYP